MIIIYFIFKLKCEFNSVKVDVSEIFSSEIIKATLFVVVLNIFFSYGMLYFSGYILNFVLSFNVFDSVYTGGLLATIVISPISEELIFRGVFLNRLQLFVPVTFAVLISSLFFASLHGFGSIFSAFVFAVCLSILYLKTDNIFVPIFAHFLNNLLAEIIVILDSNKILFTNNLVVATMSVLAIVSFAVILRFIIKQLNTINNNNF